MASSPCMTPGSLCGSGMVGWLDGWFVFCFDHSLTTVLFKLSHICLKRSHCFHSYLFWGVCAVRRLGFTDVTVFLWRSVLTVHCVVPRTHSVTGPTACTFAIQPSHPAATSFFLKDNKSQNSLSMAFFSLDVFLTYQNNLDMLFDTLSLSRNRATITPPNAP